MASELGKTTPHIFLNFDINKTLIAKDLNNDNQDYHDVVCSCIAEKYKAIWDASLTTPISYYEYVKNHLCPNESNSLKVKSKQKELLSDTLNEFKRRNFSQLDLAQAEYDAAMTALKIQKTVVFHSFF